MAGRAIVQHLPEAGLDDRAWLERCRYWATQRPEKRKGRRGPLPRRLHQPLILTGHGVRMNIDQGTLLVRQGFTHYPQEQEVYRFFSKDRHMPSRIIVVDGSGSITFDVIDWLSQQKIPLVKIDWRGNAINVTNSSYGPDPKLVRAQLAAEGDNKARLKIAITLIRAKLESSVETLRDLDPSDRSETALAKLKDSLAELSTRPPRTTNALLGIEGRSAQAYFNAWKDLPIRWKRNSRKPIPNDWLKFVSRYSNQASYARGHHATHPVNAMLNYAYAVLESRVRSQLTALGYDTTIGFIHTWREDRAALVLDLMEPLRPIVDRIVIDFVRAKEFNPGDFTIRRDGVCRLNPELAKTLVGALEGQTLGISVLVQRSFLPMRLTRLSRVA
jgi:CRISPR-associated protein Cas1